MTSPAEHPSLPLYLALGVTADGQRDVLGLWAGEHGDGEGAKYWLRVCSEIKNRGTRDVLMVVCGGLKRLPDALNRNVGRRPPVMAVHARGFLAAAGTGHRLVPGPRTDHNRVARVLDTLDDCADPLVAPALERHGHVEGSTPVNGSASCAGSPISSSPTSSHPSKTTP